MLKNPVILQIIILSLIYAGELIFPSRRISRIMNANVTQYNSKVNSYVLVCNM